MNLKEEKQKRNKFLYEVYKEAKERSPTSPISAYFRLAKHHKYNMQTKEFIKNDEERSGYILGERLGLNQEEVDAIVKYFSDNEVGYIRLLLQQFSITQLGVKYLESLEEDPYYPVQIHHNTILLGENATAQIQQNTNNSIQTQQITYTKENINELFSLLKADLAKLNQEQEEELSAEIENAIKQLDKGKDIKSRLDTIGGILKDIGIETFVSLAASPIVNILKPILGIPF
ncbi:MAG: hypothetical protein ACK504_00655 [Bacteroidota bacterium]|jgi:hypothetical protein